MTGVVVVDKPRDWTSHDVVGKLRRIYGTKRVGHGGTLDPMATGVLPVFIGRATRAADMASNADKQYVASLRFGVTTDTQDITGTVLTASPADVTREALEKVLPEFIGETEQVPPMYSAIKKDGKKLYELARKGIEVERPARRITIKSIEICGEDENGFSLRVDCSKGTYIRTLCADIGERLGCGAVMTALRRTKAGQFDIAQAVPLEELISRFEGGESVEEYIQPLHLLFADRPEAVIPPREETRLRNGAPFRTKLKDGEYRLFSQQGEFLALGRAQDGVMNTVKSFFEVK